MIKLNNAIFQILAANTGLTSIVNYNIFPVIAPEDTPEPFIVYEKKTKGANYNRSQHIDDQSIVNFYVISKTHNESVEIADMIRDTLEGFRGVVDDIEIISLLFNDDDQGYEETRDIHIYYISFLIRDKKYINPVTNENQ